MTEFPEAAVTMTRMLHDPSSDGLGPDDQQRHARVVWSTLIEPGDRVAGAAISHHGALEALERLRRGALSVPGIEPPEMAAAMARWSPRVGDDVVMRALRTAHAAQLRLLTPSDPSWPPALDDLGDHAPVVLWVRGDPEVLGGAANAVAVVGARAATSYGEHVAGEISSELAAAGRVIISGAAFGIDAAAHRAVIGVGQITVALLAGGLDRAYPQAHSQLLDRIAQTGLVMSEVAPGSAPTKWRFLQRNRLIAALSAATVVVEAGWRSGSLNTAHHAAALGRQLGAVPGPVTSAASAGCHRLIRELGATCVTCAADVQELLGEDGGARRSAADPARADSAGVVGVAPRPDRGGSHVDDRTRLLDALSTRVPRTIAEVARRSGLSLSDAQSLMGLLQLSGHVRRDDLGWRRN